MFTGIITSIGTIVTTEQCGDLHVVIGCDYAPESLCIGESVACSGVCLTVVDSAFRIQDSGFEFTVTLSAETLVRTAPRWDVGARINLERSLKMGDALDGHLVTGHVDGLATIMDITPQGDSHILALDAPEALSRLIAEKGSVTLDGVSLTVNKVEGCRFWVNIIPHTWNVTTLGERKPGDMLNLEIDLIARYIARLTGK